VKFYNVFSGFLTGATKEAYLRNIGDRKFNSLHSYWYLKDLPDEKIIDGFSITKGSIMIDSGAFTAYADAKMKRQKEDDNKKSSKPLDIDQYVENYINWINKWSDYVTTFGQMDVIPVEAKTVKDYNECCQRTWQNYIYMTNNVVCPEKILYTFHYGEPLKWLEQALEYTLPNGKKMEYIAIGGLVGRTTKQRIEFLDRCFKIIANSSIPYVKVHGFGVSSKKLWTAYPFESCDSFTPGMNANHGFTYDEYGSYREEDYKRIFKPEAPKEYRSGLFPNMKVTQKVTDYIPEEAKSEEQLKEEALYRTDEKAKLLIGNIAYWDNLANNTLKVDVIRKFKDNKTTFERLSELNKQV